MENKLIINRLCCDCCLSRKLAFRGITHVARHSFATSVTLNNDIALTSVSKMMGHTNTKITQRYAKVLESTLVKDMNSIVDKIDM